MAEGRRSGNQTILAKQLRRKVRLWLQDKPSIWLISARFAVTRMASEAARHAGAVVVPLARALLVEDALAVDAALLVVDEVAGLQSALVAQRITATGQMTVPLHLLDAAVRPLRKMAVH